jgi:hypothetical protein
MSWSFAFHAKDKDTARAVLDKVVAPEVVKEFVAQAIDGLRDDSTGGMFFVGMQIGGRVIRVKSDGHLALAGMQGSYEVSTNNTLVEWVYLLEPAPDVTTAA